MELVKFVIPPDQTSYSVADGNEVVGVKLDGGASRFRRDILNATSRVTVQWSCNPAKYKYIRGFYKAVTVSGSLPFSIDLILDEPELTSHKAYFVPDSMALREQRGLLYVVSAELEVYSAEISPYSADYVYMYNEFGECWQRYEDVLHEVVNIKWPEVL